MEARLTIYTCRIHLFEILAKYNVRKHQSPVQQHQGLYHLARRSARNLEKGKTMLVLAIIIGAPALLLLAAAGPFIESISPDELSSMGVATRS